MIKTLFILMLIFAPVARGAVRIWALAPIQILTLLILIFYLFKMFSGNQIMIKRTPLDLPILFFFFLYLITLFNSRYIYGSIMELIRLINLAAIFFIVVNFMDREQDIKRILNSILIASTAIALLGLLQYIGAVYKPWWSNSLFLSSTYVNHNHFAGLVGLTIPLSIGLFLSERETAKKTLYIYSFLILSMAFLLSMSRGGWLSLSVSIFFMTLVMSKRGKARYVLFGLILFFIILALFISNSTYIDTLLSRISSYRELDFSGRLEIWKGTIGIIKDHWLLGTGPGTFIYNFPRYRPAGLNMFVNYAHSDYLQVFSEMGIFGLGLMIFIIARIIKKGLRTHKISKTPFKSWISLSLATGILSMSLHGLGDFNFYIPANAILFTVFAGLIFNISSKRERGYPPFILKANPALHRFLKSSTTAIVTVIIIFISTSLAAEICSTESERAISNNSLEKAEQMALTAIRLCPLNYQYSYRLATIYNKKAQAVSDRSNYIKKSVKHYRASLDLNPMDGWSWIGLADSYYKLFKYSPIEYPLIGSADSAYREALDLDPLNSYYLKEFAKLLLDRGDTELSSKMFRKASYVMSKSKTLSSLPRRFTDGKLYEQKADLAFSAQDPERALIFYKMAEEFNDEKESAVLGQTRCYLKMSLIKESFREYSQIQPFSRNKSVLFASLADYYRRKGLIRTAMKFSERSINLDPENPEGYQIKYQILKKINKDSYPVSEISRILGFNNIPASLDLTSDAFKVGFDVKEKLYKDDTINLDLILPSGMYELNIKAKGKSAVSVWPHMIIRFNNKDTMNTYVNDSNWKDYTGIIFVDYPVNRLEIVYDNDYYDPENMEDRNLYIDGIRLKGLY